MLDLGREEGEFEHLNVLWIDTPNIVNKKGIIIIWIPMMWYKVTNIVYPSQYTYIYNFF